MQPRGARLIAAAALIAASGAFFWLEPIRSHEAVEIAAPFSVWPSFVASWHVQRDQASGVTGSVASSQFGSDPCAVFPAESCHVRLAWGDFARWSLTASEDPVFDSLDPRQLTVGPLHYAIADGLVLGVIDHDRLPPLHVCHGLQRRHHEGANVRVTRAQEPDPTFGDTLMLHGDTESARCTAEDGIPLAHSRPGHFWEHARVELRPPTDGEIGVDLVQVRSSSLACQVERPLSSVRAWFDDLVAAARFEPDTSRPQLGLVAPGVPDRVASAWTTQDGILTESVRKRLLAPGLISTEVLQPAVVSVPIGGLRLWLTFDTQVERPLTTLEHDLFVLGEVAKRLHSAGADRPYHGPIPSTEGCS